MYRKAAFSYKARTSTADRDKYGTYNESSVVAKAKVDNRCLYVLWHDDGLYADVVIARDVN